MAVRLLSHLGMLAALSVHAGASASLSEAARGADYSIPWLRIILSLLVCVFVAAGAILILRAYQQKQLPALFGKLRTRSLLSAPHIEIVETRRISAHADVCLLRQGGEEYLVLVGSGHSRLLDRRAAPSLQGDHESAGTAEA